MALVAKVREVSSTVTTVDSQGRSDEIDLSLQGQLLVVADYVDDTTPTVVIHTERFTVSSVESVAQIQGRIVAFGQRVRDARVTVNDFQQYVGDLIPIPATPTEPSV